MTVPQTLPPQPVPPLPAVPAVPLPADPAVPLPAAPDSPNAPASPNPAAPAAPATPPTPAAPASPACPAEAPAAPATAWLEPPVEPAAPASPPAPALPAAEGATSPPGLSESVVHAGCASNPPTSIMIQRVGRSELCMTASQLRARCDAACSPNAGQGRSSPTIRPGGRRSWAWESRSGSARARQPRVRRCCRPSPRARSLSCLGRPSPCRVRGRSALHQARR